MSGRRVVIARTAVTLTALWAAAGSPARADPLVASETGSAAIAAKYGVSGKGVIFAMIDRGIDYTHPDFRNADGTTRIKAMLDMTGQNLCSAQNPAPVRPLCSWSARAKPRAAASTRWTSPYPRPYPSIRSPAR